jgi:hypothetical protein
VSRYDIPPSGLELVLPSPRLDLLSQERFWRERGLTRPTPQGLALAAAGLPFYAESQWPSLHGGETTLLLICRWMRLGRDAEYAFLSSIPTRVVAAAAVEEGLNTLRTRATH